MPYTIEKAVSSSTPYLNATILRYQIGRAGYETSGQSASLVKRAAGYVYRCAEINANRVASTPLKLYRPVNRRRTEAMRGLSWQQAVNKARKSETPLEALAYYWPARPVKKATRRWLEGEFKVRGQSITPCRDVVNKAIAMSGDWEEVTVSPLIDVLAKPNIDENAYDLLWLQQFFIELTGTSYWLKIGTRGVENLRTLYPQYVDLVFSDPSGDGLIQAFEYGVNLPKARFDAADVVYFRSPSPIEPGLGLGPLEASIHSSNAELAIRQACTAMFERGGMIDYVMKVPAGGANQTTRDSLVAAWRRRFGGVAKWFKQPMILEDNVTLERLTDPPKDVPFSDALNTTLRDISIIFGVPVSMLTNEGANKLGQETNAQQGSDDYTLNTLHPRLIRNEQTLNSQLLPDFGSDSFVLAYEMPFTEDEAGKQVRNTGYSNSGVMTLNEAREQIDLEPLEGGDVLRFNGMPIDRVGVFDFGLSTPTAGMPAASDDQGEPQVQEQPQAEPVASDAGAAAQQGLVQDTALNGAQVTALAELVAQVSRGEIPLESAQALAGAAFPLIEDAVLDQIFAPLRNFEPAPPPTAPAPPAPPTPKPEEEEDDEEPEAKSLPAEPRRTVKQSRFMVYGDGCECCSKAADGFIEDDDAKPVAAELQAAFNGLLASILANMDDNPSVPTPQKNADNILDRLADLWGFRTVDIVEALNKPGVSQALRSMLLGGLEDGKGELAGQLELDFDLADPNVDRFLEGYRLRFREALGSAASTTEELVRGALREGLNEGQSITGLKERLQTAFNGFTPYRSELIARTETARAYTAGKEAAWSVSNVVVGKRWLLAPRACEFCEAMAKQFNKANLGEPFLRRGATLQGTQGGQMVVDFADIDGPPLHPNDRCATVPILMSDET